MAVPAELSKVVLMPIVKRHFHGKRQAVGHSPDIDNVAGQPLDSRREP